MQRKRKLSVIMMTKNAEDIIGKSLSSIVNIADEIIVADDGSTDRTREIARHYGAMVYFHREKRFGKQQQFLLKKAKYEWVLTLDSDEIVSSKLKQEIKSIINQKKNKYTAYFIPFKNYFLNRHYKYVGKNTGKISLFSKHAVRVGSDIIHQHYEIRAEKPGRTKNKINHYSNRSLRQMFAKFTNWAKKESYRKGEHGESVTLKKLILYPIHMFWARFIKDKGYKDGLFRLPLDVGYAYMEFMTYFFMLRNKLKKNTFLLNFFSFNISSLFIKILNLILFIFLVKYLSPSDYGIYSLVWAHITLLSPLMDFGTTSYGIIHLSEEKKEEFFPVFSLRFILSIIVFFLTLISGVIIFSGQGKIPFFIILISFAIFSNMVSGSYLIWVAVRQKAYISSLVSMIFNSILTIVLVLVLTGYKSLSIVFYAIFFMYLLYTIIVFILLKHQIGKKFCFQFNFSKWLLIIKKSYVFVLIGFFAGLYFKTDIYLLQFLKSERDVGIYSAGYKFFEALLFIVLSYNVSVTPIFAKLIKKGKQYLIHKMKKDIIFLFFIGITISFITYVFFPGFLSFFINKEYMQSALVLQIVIFSLPFILASSVFVNALFVMNKAFLVVYVYLFQIVFNIILNLIFIPKYSYIASAYITVGSEIINTIILFIIFYNTFNLKFKTLSFLRRQESI